MYKHILLLLTTLILIGCTSTPPQLWEQPNELTLQSGDIVFREGSSIESSTVNAVDKQTHYTHVGIVININQQTHVLHAVPNERDDNEKDSVKLEPISQFFRSDRATSGCIMRPKIEHFDTTLIYNECMKIYSRRPLFDNTFNLNDTTSYYCTELIYHIFKNTHNIDISQNIRQHYPLFPPLILCSSIYTHPHLRKIHQF